jgi:hypothetical protein
MNYPVPERYINTRKGMNAVQTLRKQEPQMWEREEGWLNSSMLNLTLWCAPHPR